MHPLTLHTCIRVGTWILWACIPISNELYICINATIQGRKQNNWQY